MDLKQVETLYSRLPQAGALIKTLEDNSVKRILLQGLVASSAPMLFSSIADKLNGRTVVFIMDDADEAGYVYNDLCNINDYSDLSPSPSPSGRGDAKP